MTAMTLVLAAAVAATAPSAPSGPSIEVLWGCAGGSTRDCLRLADLELWCPPESMGGEMPCQEPEGTPSFDACMQAWDAERRAEGEELERRRQAFAELNESVLRRFAGPPRLRITLPAASPGRKGRAFLFALLLEAEYPDTPVRSEGDAPSLQPLKKKTARRGGVLTVPMPLDYSLAPDTNAILRTYLQVVVYFADSLEAAEVHADALEDSCRQGCDVDATLLETGLTAGRDFAALRVDNECIPVAKRPSASRR